MMSEISVDIFSFVVIGQQLFFWANEQIALFGPTGPVESAISLLRVELEKLG